MYISYTRIVTCWGTDPHFWILSYSTESFLFLSRYTLSIFFFPWLFEPQASLFYLLFQSPSPHYESSWSTSGYHVQSRLTCCSASHLLFIKPILLLKEEQNVEHWWPLINQFFFCLQRLPFFSCLRIIPSNSNPGFFLYLTQNRASRIGYMLVTNSSFNAFYTKTHTGWQVATFPCNFQNGVAKCVINGRITSWN